MAGDGDGESAKYRLVVLTQLRNRGVKDGFFVVRDGLKGLPDSFYEVFPEAIVQTCFIHLIRNTFRFASRKYWDQDQPRHRTDLHRPDSRGGPGALRGVRRELGLSEGEGARCLFSPSVQPRRRQRPRRRCVHGQRLSARSPSPTPG